MSPLLASDESFAEITTLLFGFFVFVLDLWSFNFPRPGSGYECLLAQYAGHSWCCCLQCTCVYTCSSGSEVVNGRSALSQGLRVVDEL